MYILYFAYRFLFVDTRFVLFDATSNWKFESWLKEKTKTKQNKNKKQNTKQKQNKKQEKTSYR